MKRAILMVAMVLATAMAVAKATEVVVNYPGDRVINELNSVSSGETAALDSTAYANRVFDNPNSRPNLTISGSFSSAGANAVIGVCRGTKQSGSFKPYRWAPVTFVTITADGTHTIGGRYVGNCTIVDTCNCDAMFVFVKSVSAGSVIAGWSLH